MKSQQLGRSKYAFFGRLSKPDKFDYMKKRFGADYLFTPKQVHGNTVLIIDENSSEEETAALEADALVTQREKILLGVSTADCVPVLFYLPIHEWRGSYIGAAHAGWRGAKSGVLDSTIYTLLSLSGKSILDLRAVIGPAIAGKHYKVKEDLYMSFMSESPQNIKYFMAIPGGGNSFLFELREYVKGRLLNSGMLPENIEDSRIDIYPNPRFFSHRRSSFNGEPQGRNVSVIGTL